MTGEELIKKVLTQARGQIQEEVGGLLGTPLKVTKPQLRRVSKAEYFAEPGRNLALTRVAVDGEVEAEVEIFVRLQDAILLGGTLIMLPPSEMEDRIKKEAFGEEEADAFGEIANIIAGVLNSVFGSVGSQKLRFRKVDLLPVVGDDLDLAAADPFPPQEFLLGAYPMVLEGEPLGDMEILFPTALAGPAGGETGASPEPAGETSAVEEETVREAPEGGPHEADVREEAGSEDPDEDGAPLVLILADHGCDAEDFSQALQGEGCRTERLGLQDDVKGYLQTQRRLRGVVLVMDEVSERGFAAAIQVRSVADETIPLIAAGPEWTRSTVLQAVKFGVRDILVTPASPEEIRGKIGGQVKSRAEAG